MSAAEQYDIAIVGGGLGGEIAAAAVARAGRRALRLFDPDALAEEMPETPLLRRLLEALGVDPPASEPAPLQTRFQVVLPEGRFDLTGDGEADAREILRELPDAEPGWRALDRAGEAILALVDQLVEMETALPATGFWARRDLGRRAGDAKAHAEELLRLAPDESAFARLLAAPIPFLGLPVDRAGQLTQAGLWSRLGRPRLRDRSVGAREALREHVRAAGGEVTPVRGELAITLRRGQPVAIAESNGPPRAIAHLIWASSIALLPAAFPEGRQRNRLARTVESSRAREGTTARFDLRLPLAALPPGLDRRLFLAGDPTQSAPARREPVWLETDRKAGNERATIRFCTVLPTGEATDQVTRQILLERIGDLLPFLDPKEIETAEAPALAPGLRSLAPKAVLGLEGLPYQPGPRQLTLASGELLPGLGADGALLAAWFGAKRAVATMKKPKERD